MSGSTGTGKPDQRDIDEELLSRTPARRIPLTDPDTPPPGMLTLPENRETELQQALDRATGGGLYPHWDNRPDHRKTDDACVVYHGTRRCRMAATVRIWIGCPSEHIAPSDACEAHADEAERTRLGWRCSLCWDATGTVVLARYIRREPLAHADLGGP